MPNADHKRQYTERELEELALLGRPVNFLKPEPEPEAKKPEPKSGKQRLGPKITRLSPHYGVITVGENGGEHAGQTFLVGMTEYGKKLVYQGRVNRLLELKCPRHIAVVAASMTHGMEPVVWNLVRELIPIIQRGVKLSGVQSHVAFRMKAGIDSIATMPKIWSAIRIACEVIWPSRRRRY